MLLVVVIGVLLWVVIAVPAGIFFVGAATNRRPRETRPHDEHPIWLMEAGEGGDAVYLMEDGHRIRVRKQSQPG